MKNLRFVLATLVVLYASAVANDYMVGDIRIEHPWSRALPEVAPNGAAYMTLSNRGAVADRLMSGSSPIAKRVGLHRHTMEGGVMRMRPVEAIEVAPGQPTLLQPGGLHIMLMGLKEPLVKGKTFPLTLKFERAGSIEVLVPVQETNPSSGDGG